jgi:hypothetical protein
MSVFVVIPVLTKDPAAAGSRIVAVLRIAVAADGTVEQVDPGTGCVQEVDQA